jgi:hypothetical protein
LSPLPTELLGSCIAVAVLAALYEGLKVGRELLDDYMTESSVDSDNRCECAHRDDRSRVTNESQATSTVITIGRSKGDRKGCVLLFCIASG